MNDNALGTMVGNELGRGNKDSANRDMIGDQTSGAMGTIITNNQGIASNAVSDYNSGHMTDIQKNMGVIDSIRGYGDSPYDQSPAQDLSSTSRDSYSPSSFSPNSSMYGTDLNTQNVGFNGSPSHTAMNTTNMDSVDLYSSASAGLFAASAVKPSGTGSMNKPGGTLFVKKRLVPTASSMESTENSKENNTAEKTESKKTASPKNAKNNNIEDEDDENTIKKPTPTTARGTSNINIRPVIMPTSMKNPTKEDVKQTKKDVLKNKLHNLTHEDFFKLLEKTKTEVESGDKEKSLVAECKMKLLQDEAEKRMRAIKAVS